MTNYTKLRINSDTLTNIQHIFLTIKNIKFIETNADGRNFPLVNLEEERQHHRIRDDQRGSEMLSFRIRDLV